MNIMLMGAFTQAETAPAPVKIARILCREFAGKAHTVNYITYFGDGRKYSRVRKFFGKEKISSNIFRLGIFPMINFIARTRPEILQLVNAESFYLFVFLFKPLLKFKVAYFNHSLISYTFRYFNNLNRIQTLRFRLIEHIVLHFSDLIFVFTERDERYLRRYKNIRASAVARIQHGVYQTEMCKYDFNGYGTVKIVTAGSFRRKEKNLDALIHALAATGRNFLLTVCTNDVEKPQVRVPASLRLKIINGLSEEGVRREFVRNDLFILNSAYESFSLTTLEAMSAGMIVLVTDRTGITEYFSNEFEAMVYPYKNIPLFLEKLQRLCDLSAAGKKNLSGKIRRFAGEFTWDKSVYQILNCYNQCLKNPDK